MNMHKKVLLCITKSAEGGAQKYIYDIATHLPTDQFEPVIVAGGSGRLFVMAQKEGIRTISVPSLERDIYPLKDVRAFFQLIRIFIKEKPDIIHLNSSKMGSMGACAARVAQLLTLNFKPRVIFTVHGWGFREDRNTIQRMAIFAASWIAARFHHHTIAINSADHKDARAFIPHKKITFLPLGISPPAFASRRDSRAFFKNTSGRDINNDTLLIGTTAELVKNKGLSYLIDALGRVVSQTKQSNIHCVIMGEGEERGRLTHRIKELNLEHHISLVGFVPDCHRYLLGLDLFILSSLKEGLPYALMEAMAAGLPVIASYVGGIPDMITHNINGLLTPAKNSGVLANHISNLLVSHDQRKQLGATAQQTIATQFPLDRMITKTTNLYHELTQPYQ